MDLYERICEVAKEKNYSINRLEKECGFARSYISKFRKVNPSIDKIQKIADVLGVSPEYIISGEKPEIPVLSDPNVVKLADMFLKLDKEHRALVLDVIRSMLPPDQV